MHSFKSLVSIYINIFFHFFFINPFLDSKNDKKKLLKHAFNNKNIIYFQINYTYINKYKINKL